METKKVYLITHDVGDDPYDYYTVNDCVCETEELAIETVKEFSKGPENPFDDERVKLYENVQIEWENWICENDNVLDNFTNQEINHLRDELFEKNGFSKEDIEKYENFIGWNQMNPNNWEITEIDYFV